LGAVVFIGGGPADRVRAAFSSAAMYAATSSAVTADMRWTVEWV